MRNAAAMPKRRELLLTALSSAGARSRAKSTRTWPRAATGSGRHYDDQGRYAEARSLHDVLSPFENIRPELTIGRRGQPEQPRAARYEPGPARRSIAVVRALVRRSNMSGWLIYQFGGDEPTTLRTRTAVWAGTRRRCSSARVVNV